MDADHPRATIVGDLTQAGVLAEGVFDCIVFTQTLHLIFDMATALANLRAALRPGGVLPIPVPGSRESTAVSGTTAGTGR